VDLIAFWNIVRCRKGTRVQATNPPSGSPVPDQS
jgi:hypothetical protein